ncbi:MAG: glycoside hydrolase family 3 protein, partial [Salinispira sp.]
MIRQDNRQEMRKKIGRLFVCGFDGTEINEHVDFLLRELTIANWVLFARNVSEYGQVAGLCRNLTRETQRINGMLPFVSIDQEGGIVSRLHGDMNMYPGAMALAALDDVDIAATVARITGEHLRALGFNMNLAPVCDINSNPKNPIIGTRSFGDSPLKVAAFAAAVMKGYMSAGVIPVLKHFPGHGDTDLDSHLELPLLPHERSILEKRELHPFRHCIQEGAPAVMTAHIRVPALDDSKLPASLSKQLVQGLLRSSLNFDGLVLTDCLEMKGVSARFSIGDAVLHAFEAGTDLLLISHRAEEQERGFKALYDAAISGKISESRIDHSLNRMEECRRAMSLNKHPAPAPDSLPVSREDAGTGGASVSREGAVSLPDSREYAGTGGALFSRIFEEDAPFLREVSRKSLTLVRDRGFLSSGSLPNSPETLILSLERPEQFIGENTVSGGIPIRRLQEAFPRADFHSIHADRSAQEILHVDGVDILTAATSQRYT